jgi:predicted aspartyl protease
MSKTDIVFRAIAVHIALFVVVGCQANQHPSRSVSVQFQTSRSQILVPVRIGYEKATRWFLLDTAVDPSVIDDSMLELDGIELVSDETHEAEGAGDEKGISIRLARVIRYAVGDWEMSTLEAVAADQLAGILGYSFLKDKVVRIDYGNKQLDLALERAALPDRAGDCPQAHKAPLQFMSSADLIPVVELLINDQLLRVTLDTGSSLGVQIYDSAVSRLGLDSVRDEAEASSITGARGQAGIRTTTLDSIVMGPFEEHDMPVSFSRRQHNPSERQGNVGNRFLERFLLTLDYVEGLAVFEHCRD